MKNKSIDNNEKNITINYGTDMKNVVKISDINISVFDESLGNDKVVIAKENDNFYVTVKSYVDSGLLDPYKCYKKDFFEVKPIENVDDGPKFSIKFKNIDPGIVF